MENYTLRNARREPQIERPIQHKRIALFIKKKVPNNRQEIKPIEAASPSTPSNKIKRIYKEQYYSEEA